MDQSLSKALGDFIEKKIRRPETWGHVYIRLINFVSKNEWNEKGKINWELLEKRANLEAKSYLSKEKKKRIKKE